MEFTVKYLALVAVCLAQLLVIQATLYQMCDLRPDEPFVDPMLLPEGFFHSGGRPSFPESTVARLLERSPARAAVLATNRRLAALNRRAAAASRNVTKREVGAQYIAAAKREVMCEQQEVYAAYSLDVDNALCQLIPDQPLIYATCGQASCRHIQNGFPWYQTYRCEPDTYVYMPAMAVCQRPDNGEAELREQAFYVPINCCCRRYQCNFSRKFKIPQLI